MHISRDPKDIDTVAKFSTLFKHGEKGKFFCHHCGKILNDLLNTLPNDGGSYVRPCSNCGTMLLFDPGWLAAKMIEENLRRNAGLPPVVEPKNKKISDRSPKTGVIKEIVKPDGSKIIIACPEPAIGSSVALGWNKSK